MFSYSMEYQLFVPFQGENSTLNNINFQWMKLWNLYPLIFSKWISLKNSWREKENIVDLSVKKIFHIVELLRIFWTFLKIDLYLLSTSLALRSACKRTHSIRKVDFFNREHQITNFSKHFLISDLMFLILSH